MMLETLTLAWALMVGAQEAAPPPTEAPVAEPATSGPQWRRFSETGSSSYLLDMASVQRVDGEATIRVARVSKRLQPGDYAHVIDLFGVRCQASETRVESTTEVGPDGEPVETYAADEPWAPATGASFDAAVKEVACGEMEPNQAPFASVRAWIDAGRP